MTSGPGAHREQRLHSTSVHTWAGWRAWRTTRRALALLVGLFGMAAVAAGASISVASRLSVLGAHGELRLQLAGQAFLLQAGVALLACAWGLRRGYRVAWWAAIAVAGAGAAIQVIELRWSDVVTWLALGGLGALWFGRRAFRLRLRWRAYGWLFPLLAVAAGATYAITAYGELDAAPSVSLAGRLALAARTALFLRGGLGGDNPSVEAYALGLRVAALAIAGATVAAVATRRASLSGVDVAALVRRHGRSPTAPLVSLPGNDVLPLCGNTAVAGLVVRNRVAVCVGAPVGPEASLDEAMAELLTATHDSGWTPVLLGLDAPGRALASAHGLAVIKIGEDAEIDVATFDTTGKRRANLRHSVARARRDGLSVLRYTGPARTEARDQGLRRISEAWLASKGGPELGLTLGRFDLNRLDEQEVYVALVDEGARTERVAGFVTWLVYLDGSAAVLDLMRRADDCPPGTMETLIVDSLADFRRRGRSTASLGGVPLADTAGRDDALARTLGWMYEHGGSLYEAKGLFRFKDKFAPRWQPLYLAYPSAVDLPRIALAIARAFLPRGAAREAWHSHRHRIRAVHAGHDG